MKFLEKLSFIFLVAGLFLFSLAFLTLALVPAWSTKSVEKTAMLPDIVPEDFAPYYSSVEDYRKALFQGRDIYVAEACWHCHSQYIRPVSNESLRYGPISTAGEYQNMLQMPQMLGTRRVGPDLIREAGKRTNDWHFAHLYNPKSVTPVSVMPSYRWLFDESQGEPKAKASAVALVAYLQWLGSWVKDKKESVYTKDLTMVPPTHD